MNSTLPKHLWSLIKPRIVTLLCITGVFSLLGAGGSSPGIIVAFTIAGASIAASAAAFNCWYDRNLDRHMERTADRPLPSGRLDHRIAAGFATALLVLGSVIGVLTLPLVSVGYMLLGAASYVGLYTVLLKRRHWIGVVLGGSAGSFPVLAGWTAVRPLTWEAIAMAAVVFAWTPAHAWALAYVYRSDFAAAEVPTLPVVASKHTVQRRVWYSALSTVVVAACVIPFADPPYGVAALVGGTLFLLGFAQFYREGSEPAAVRAFFTSNLYLATLFLAWGVGEMLTVEGTVLRATTIVGLVVAFVGLWRARPELRGVAAAPGGVSRVSMRKVWVGFRSRIGDLRRVLNQ